MPLASTRVLPFADSPTLAGSAVCASATPEPSATIAAAIATERIVLMPKLLGFPGEAVPASRVLIRDASRTPGGLAIFATARKSRYRRWPGDKKPLRTPHADPEPSHRVDALGFPDRGPQPFRRR